MTMVVTLVRRTMKEGLSPEIAMARINDQLNERNPGSMFVTLVICVFDPLSGDISYASAGHLPPLVFGPSGARFFDSEDPDPLAGAFPDLKYKLRRERLLRGEACLLFTDGGTEALNMDKSLFGAERLAESLGSDNPKDNDHALLTERVAKAIEDFRGEAPQSDDVALLAFRRKDD